MSITAGHLPAFGNRVRAPRVSIPGGTRVAWGRVAALLTIIALSALLGAGIRAATAAAPVRSDDGAAVARTALVEHVVQPGDTLWALALRVEPTSDPRLTVERIMRLNNLESADVAVGRVLLLPRS